MTAAREIADGLRGALQIAIGRAEGIRFIRGDSPAVTRSFAAAAFCLPAFLLLDMMDWRSHGAVPRLGHALAVEGLCFAIGWAGFLLACRPVLAAMGRLGAWPRLVAVSNWCSVVQQMVWLAAAIPTLLAAGGAVSDVVGVVALGWSLWIEWFAFRLVLGLGPFAVGGIVALDLLIGLGTDLISSALIR